MSESLARAILRDIGERPNRYVSGSMRLVGRHLDWAEKCSPRCRHDAECHIARSALMPQGQIDDKHT